MASDFPFVLQNDARTMTPGSATFEIRIRSSGQDSFEYLHRLEKFLDVVSRANLEVQAVELVEGEIIRLYFIALKHESERVFEHIVCTL